MYRLHVQRMLAGFIPLAEDQARSQTMNTMGTADSSTGEYIVAGRAEPRALREDICPSTLSLWSVSLQAWQPKK